MKLILLTLLSVSLFSVNAFSETIKVACVGDSITYGAGIKDRKNMNYPVQLGKLLGPKYEVKNFGNSGSTMLKKGDKPFWKQREYKASLDFNPNIVVIKLGTNDTKPQNWKHGAEYSDDYKSMISAFAELSSKPKIYICLPVPVVKTRWGITDAIVNKDIIPALKKLSAQTKCEIIDLNSPFKGKHQLIPDHVHPNGAGATIIAKTVWNSIHKNQN
ncbi:MAG: sialate O-acetylesterase [Akkermansiaceae bacterium]|jgi:acyl-CoA thioesterase I|nr:sialate O-acetylesterase [Akkermansiaceae bacterium]MDG1855101.1 GDSL-type esterase/lipase family protein [Verrucomicrobiales bacterium]